jgi:hypothetical protein
MKCSHCGKDYTFKSVQERYGSTYYAEYGCCSEKCYKDKVSGIPAPNNDVHKKS